MSNLLSLRGYAKHRGVTLRAVQKAIESGRIQTVLDEKGKPKVDPVEADLRWVKLADPAMQRNPPKPVRPQPESEPTCDDLAGDDPGDDSDGSHGYYNSRAMREKYNAKLAKLAYEVKVGELIEAGQVKAEWQKIISTTKTRLLSVPSKVRARVPHLTLSDMATMEEEIRAALEEMSQGRGPESD